MTNVNSVSMQSRAPTTNAGRIPRTDVANRKMAIAANGTRNKPGTANTGFQILCVSSLVILLSCRTLFRTADTFAGGEGQVKRFWQEEELKRLDDEQRARAVEGILREYVAERSGSVATGGDPPCRFPLPGITCLGRRRPNHFRVWRRRSEVRHILDTQDRY